MGRTVSIALVSVAIFGCSSSQDYCAIPPETSDRPPIKARGTSIYEYFPGILHADITRIHFSSRSDPVKPGTEVGVYSLDGQEYSSMDQILEELDRRKQQLHETGVWHMPVEKIPSETTLDSCGVLAEYCEANDIDLFISYALGLPPLYGGTNTYWVVESSTTNYILPKESREKVEYLEFDNK